MTTPAPHDAPDAALLLAQARSLPQLRVIAFEHDAKRYWVKRPEKPPLRLRLQKGNGQRAFQRELARLNAFAAKGAPVPPVLAQAPDIMVLADAGTPLTHLAYGETADSMQVLLSHAATALAQMHARALAHGRPRLRDICWDGAQIQFVDLEAGARLNAPRWRRARDLLVFLHSIWQNDPDISAAAPAALAAYTAADSAQIVPLARRMARHLRLVGYLATPLVRRDRKRNKTNSEFVAFAQLLDFLA
ncbi:hypothetical protein [Roseinatronobacter sp. NSM]|uniref:hypothetical protein n=1 Tax=Roseinatronobacter sp. NSM TaxID=3457785 RepID=UPI0040369BFF